MQFTLKGKIAKAHPYQLDKTLTVEGTGAEAEATGKAINAAKKIAEDHIETKTNPHSVTKAQVGLGNVDDTSDADKPVSRLQAIAIAEAKLAGTNAQTAAENAQEAADNAQTSADNAQTAADEAKELAESKAQEAEQNAKNYSDSKHLPLTATIGTVWEGITAPYYQLVAIEGILKEDHPHVMPRYTEDLASAISEKEAWAMIDYGMAEDGGIAFICFEDKPVTAIPIQIEVNR